MKYFLDTEFIEDGKTIDLISIGIISENCRSYYAISTEFEPSKASNWVKENVLNKLPKHPDYSYKSKTLIKENILEFIGTDKPIFYGYYADYDWVVFCQLFGKMIDLPKEWPMYCRDLKQMLDDRGNPKIIIPKNNEHNALDDAIWNKEVYGWLIRL